MPPQPDPNPGMQDMQEVWGYAQIGKGKLGKIADIGTA
jgi:hypothetical protein